MKKLLLSSLVLFLIFEIGIAQCKYEKSISSSNKFSKSDLKPEILVATPTNNLFRKFIGIGYSFSKSEDNNLYLYLIIGTNGQKFEIRKTNPLTITFDDKTEMSFLPDGDYTGKWTGPINFQIGTFYKITIEQLEKLANKPIINLKVIFSDDEQNKDSVPNDDGTYSYNIEISNTKNAEELMKMADCMLNYK